MNEEVRKQLTNAIENYRDNRERLVKIQMSTKEAFNQIAKILERPASELLEAVNIQNFTEIPTNLGVADDKDIDNSTIDMNDNLAATIFCTPDILQCGKIDNPAIAVIGQIKAGKSTFVNVLLRKNVVTQAFDRCTARLTRLHYSDKNYVKILDKNGKVLEKKNLKMPTVPKMYVQLSNEERNDPEEVSKQISAGIKSEFLKCGIDIIDSPGLSENESLDKLSKNIVKNMLPVLIYVIDGCTSVKQMDISYLTELKSKFRTLQIIYFITKLDTDDLNETKSKDPIVNAKIKLDIAFKKLQHSNLIPKTFSHWSECPYFHGASLYQYMDYFKNKFNDETKFHFNLFSNFEKAVHGFLLEQFKFKINEACESLLNFQMDILTKIIRKAQLYADMTKENLNQITTMKKIEEELYEKIKSVINESKEQLQERLVMRLRDETESVISPIAEMEYPESLGIPEDGMVSEKEIIQNCNYSIMTMVCQSLENIILLFIEQELFHKYREAIEANVTKRMIDEIGNHQNTVIKSPYRVSLERLLASKYKFNAITGLNDVEGKGAVMKFLESILNSIKSFLQSLFKASHHKEIVDVKNRNWKTEQAQNCLNRLNHKVLAEDVCKNLINDFEERHITYCNALEQEQNFIQQDIVNSEETKQKVAAKAPDFAGLLMLTLDVKGRYQLQNVKEIDKIGQGAQGEVFHCTINGEHFAKKTTTLPTDQLNGIAEEVYYSYLFKHPRMLPLEAVSIQDTEEADTKKISVYSPLMKTDVSKFLKRSKTTLKQRMDIGLQVAEALLYMHSYKIMHRDLKLANILLDENDNVYLADYGFCKSMALTSHSFVGTPVHIAPEIVRKEIYDQKVDIFSFGILLWYLAEGTGRHPRFARVQSNIAQVLWAATEHNMRPEKLECISSELWELMENCWDTDSVNRPDIDVVIKRLKAIMSSFENE